MEENSTRLTNAHVMRDFSTRGLEINIHEGSWSRKIREGEKGGDKKAGQSNKKF